MLIHNLFIVALIKLVIFGHIDRFSTKPLNTTCVRKGNNNNNNKKLIKYFGNDDEYVRCWHDAVLCLRFAVDVAVLFVLPNYEEHG